MTEKTKSVINRWSSYLFIFYWSHSLWVQTPGCQDSGSSDLNVLLRSAVLTSSVVASQTAGISYSIHSGSEAAGGPFPGEQQVLQAAPLARGPAALLGRWLKFLVLLLVRAPSSAELATLRLLVPPFVVGLGVLLLGGLSQSLLKALQKRLCGEVESQTFCSSVSETTTGLLRTWIPECGLGLIGEWLSFRVTSGT